jgi:hypothetical protein
VLKQGELIRMENKLVFGKFFKIRFRNMIAIGYKFEDYSVIRPDTYINTIMLLFIEITWGQI